MLPIVWRYGADAGGKAEEKPVIPTTKVPMTLEESLTQGGYLQGITQRRSQRAPSPLRQPRHRPAHVARMTTYDFSRSVRLTSDHK